MTSVKINHTYLLKGDISGIQKFIFSVKSEGASKSLKARSFFLQAATKLTIELLKERISGTYTPIYDGGGNFCARVETEDTAVFDALQNDLNKALQKEDLMIVLGFVPYQIGDDYGQTIEQVDAQIQARKLQVYSFDIEYWDANKRPKIDAKVWKDLTKTLSLAKDADFFNSDDDFSVNKNSYTLLKKQYRLNTNANTGDLVGKMDNKLPLITEELLSHANYGPIIADVDMAERERYKYRQTIKPEDYPDYALKDTEEGDILEFEAMAGFAYERTGTRKLGVLKMDVDDLGKFIRGIKSEDEAKKQSEKLNAFFSEHLYTLWQKSEFQSKLGPTPFEDNIYIVFAGGDDLMMVGAWDAVFEFVSLIRHEFITYSTNNMHQRLTISGALLLFDAKFPVVRFADMAEDALHKAKSFEKGLKDKINIFGQVLSWEDFGMMKGIQEQLKNLITKANKPEPRRLLERIKQSGVEFMNLQEQALTGTIHIPKVWRLFYFLRNVERSNKNEIEDMFGKYERALINEYNKALLRATISKTPVSAAVFPVAARWTEFLTRKK